MHSPKKKMAAEAAVMYGMLKRAANIVRIPLVKELFNRHADEAVVGLLDQWLHEAEEILNQIEQPDKLPHIRESNLDNSRMTITELAYHLSNVLGPDDAHRDSGEFIFCNGCGTPLDEPYFCLSRTCTNYKARAFLKRLLLEEA
jgi:hypothetical protein